MPEIGRERGLIARFAEPAFLAAFDTIMLLYNLETGVWLGALEFSEGDIQALSFSVNGELLVAAGGKAGDSGRAVVWNVRTANRLGVFGQEYDTLLAADLSPDHRMIALGGPDRVVRVYSTSDSQLLYELTEHTDWILAVKFTPDGEVLATADRAGGLNLWQAANGRHVETLRGHEGSINSLAYTIDSTVLASAGQDGTVRLWDTWSYSPIRQISAHGAAVTSVDFSTDNA
jgi:WD40 repeat protein